MLVIFKYASFCRIGEVGSVLPGNLTTTVESDSLCRCPAYSMVWLWYVLHTEESDSAVYLRVWLCWDLHTTESDSPGACLPQDTTMLCPAYTPRCPVYRRVWLCCVLHTVESDSAVYGLSNGLTMLGPAYSGVWLHGVLSIAGSDHAVSCIQWSHSPVSSLSQGLTMSCIQWIGVWPWGVLSIAWFDYALSCIQRSLTPRCPAHHRVWLCCVLHTEESDSPVFCLSQGLTMLGPSYSGV